MVRTAGRSRRSRRGTRCRPRSRRHGREPRATKPDQSVALRSNGVRPAKCCAGTHVTRASPVPCVPPVEFDDVASRPRDAAGDRRQATCTSGHRDGRARWRAPTSRRSDRSGRATAARHRWAAGRPTARPAGETPRAGPRQRDARRAPDGVGEDVHAVALERNVECPTQVMRHSPRPVRGRRTLRRDGIRVACRSPDEARALRERCQRPLSIAPNPRSWPLGERFLKPRAVWWAGGAQGRSTGERSHATGRSNSMGRAPRGNSGDRPHRYPS